MYRKQENKDNKKKGAQTKRKKTITTLSSLVKAIKWIRDIHKCSHFVSVDGRSVHNRKEASIRAFWLANRMVLFSDAYMKLNSELKCLRNNMKEKRLSFLFDNSKAHLKNWYC